MSHYSLRVRTLFHGFLNPFISIASNPVIVLGHQKSGTSAIANLLADCADLTRSIDIPQLWPPIGFEIMQGKKRLIDVVNENKVPFSKQLIKEPMLTFFYDEVKAIFPQGRYIFICRNPFDNIRSLLNSRQIPGNLETLSDSYRPTNPFHKNIVDSSLWGGGEENYIGVLSNRWNKAVDVFLNAPEEFVLIRYEDFLVDKVGSITSLAHELGLMVKNDITKKVDIQYQPRGNREVSWEKFFGLSNLQLIERICSSRMKVLDYDLHIL